MEQKQRFFIYGRKEMGVLILLGLMVAIFAFTLGVHLGKRVHPKVAAQETAQPPEASAVETLPDKVPNKQEITEQSKSLDSAADESLGQALHEEVIKTGIRLDQPRQLELPKNSKAAKGNTEPPPSEASPESAAPAEAQHAEAAPAETAPLAHAPEAAESPETPSAPAGTYAVQVGAFPSLAEAQHHATALKGRHIPAFVRSAEVKRKKWYRVFAGRYSTRVDAEKAGATYQSKKLIDSFVVAKVAD